ncbi:MAG: class I SAM-dependent methyltransferase [bacterium]|nr:class I SAM-dependent methyltransferase [bacterium]MDZ4299445.1 class I SAM-dependent methyltransferase [Candidatus Sungbacteria bacterium]
MDGKRLNVGCGTDIKKGWVNLDSATVHGVDVVHDIEQLPLPFPDGSFDEILAQDVLEHIDYPRVLKDLHRILKADGMLNIRVPHFTSKNNFVDPTHRKLFSVSTFDFFIRGVKLKEKRAYYFDFTFARATDCRITFEHSSRWFFYNRFMDTIINRSPAAQRFYESTGLSRIFPAENIIITLQK